jgi:hypothetical protein
MKLRRRTPERKGSRGRKTGYSMKRGQAVYEVNRSHCHKSHKIDSCPKFIKSWNRHSNQMMVCTKMLYFEPTIFYFFIYPIFSWCPGIFHRE